MYFIKLYINVSAKILYQNDFTQLELHDFFSTKLHFHYVLDAIDCFSEEEIIWL